MKQTATVQVAGAPAKFLQVFPFMNGLSAFINRVKKKRPGRSAATPAAPAAATPGPGRAVKSAADAASGAPLPPAGGTGKGGPGARELQPQPFQGDFDEDMAWAPSASDRFGFEEMVQQNARLRKGDAMRPYDGIIPTQQQLMQGKHLQQTVSCSLCVSAEPFAASRVVR